ncbi:MAG: serine/threonine protein kinase [Pirellulales bacterium]|nr:serine/threonine protein kinase [Pirellulales bacterium]
MKTPQGTAFERCALASGLLTREQLNAARAALGWPAHFPIGAEVSDREQELANQVVQMGHLNPWQALQLLEGRTKFNLGPYWIVDSIGRGGMGQVFKGEHSVLGRVVAIKVLPQSKSTPEAVANFTREIRAQARLDHENLVRAFDAGEDGNVYYLVVEYVAGADLRKLVRSQGPLSMQQAASITAQVAAALQHAHEAGLIHRDVKPGNVLVTPDGHAKLSDLGLAGPLDADPQSDPRFGRIVGTADYVSPDHIKYPANPTPAWDIYSLGCTLYYAVTGKVPFPGGSTADKARAHCELRPLDPRRLNPSLSAEFVEVVADMMAKDPRERISSAAEVRVRLWPWMGPLTAIPMDPVPLSSRSEGSGALGTAGKLRPRGREEAAQKQEGDWKETLMSFPDLAELIHEAAQPSAPTLQSTDPAASAAEQTYSALDIKQPDPWDGILLHPLVVLVLLPMSLVGLVMLIWWLLHLPG